MLMRQHKKTSLAPVAPVMRHAFFIALGLLVGVPKLAMAVTLNVTTIDVPTSTRTAVNFISTNAMAGEFDDAGGNTHGFVLRGGVYTQIDKPGATRTTVNGISANDQLTGTYNDSSGQHVYLWSAGSFTTLDPPGRVFSQGFVGGKMYVQKNKAARLRSAPID
jgi:hypothetical protein